MRFLAGTWVLLITMLLPACAKAGRVAMSLEPNHEAVIVVDGRRPHVRIDTLDKAPLLLEVQSLAGPSREPGRLTVGTYDSTHNGPTRFTLRNATDKPVLVELKATGHSGFVVEQAPVPENGDAP